MWHNSVLSKPTTPSQRPEMGTGRNSTNFLRSPQYPRRILFRQVRGHSGGNNGEHRPRPNTLPPTLSNSIPRLESSLTRSGYTATKTSKAITHRALVGSQTHLVCGESAHTPTILLEHHSLRGTCTAERITTKRFKLHDTQRAARDKTCRASMLFSLISSFPSRRTGTFYPLPSRRKSRCAGRALDHSGAYFPLSISADGRAIWRER